MTLNEAMLARHSVRSYQQRPLEEETKNLLADFIRQCNEESGLHMQLVTDEPKAFDSTLAHYGKFSGVTNYIALVGKKASDLEEKCGYYGEKVVLYAQTLGLNTCWVALTFKNVKDAYVAEKDEKLCLVIAVGYGNTQGVQHKSKSAEAVADLDGAPQWFVDGVNAALLAPTAVNQQKFRFRLVGDKVQVKAGLGFNVKTDTGIVKYHFELGAGRKIEWEK